MTKTYTIDASGKIFGRVASEAARALIGKNLKDYTTNKVFILAKTKASFSKNTS